MREFWGSKTEERLFGGTFLDHIKILLHDNFQTLTAS